MPFEPGYPAISHDALTDIEQIRENLNQLRKIERGVSAPANPEPGMLWLETPVSGDWVLYQRNKDNDAWLPLWNLTTTGVPSGHYAQSTLTASVHGARQGSGYGFDADKLDGSHLADIAAKISQYYQGNSGQGIYARNDQEKYGTYGTTYVKVKELYLRKVPESGLKIYFEMKGTGGDNYSLYGQIYRNDAAVGTQRQRASYDSGWGSWSEQISGWADGNYLQLYVKTNVSEGPVYVRNFRILGVSNVEITME